MSMNGGYRQYELEHNGRVRVCWLDMTTLKRGQRVTLKKEERIWTIVRAYDRVMDAPPLKTWRVGGLTS